MNTEAGLVKSFVLTLVGHAMALVSDKFVRSEGWLMAGADWNYFLKLYTGQ